MPIWGFLLVWSFIFSAPLILLLLLARRRINRLAGCGVLALSFACATSYMIWRVEWFDVWRHGTPPASQLFIYGVYAAAYGAIGWFVARTILQERSVRGRIRET